ncbi:MAG: RNA polymerase sigma factor RpoD/SigA [Deltaproteobacteria bacterium]|nr:RNA polymerase sigma factor RpoD/SigA [Deltaproteobacteria bacterium]
MAEFFQEAHGACSEGAQPEKHTASDSIKIYFESIRKHPLLTADEEKKLARKVKRGDKEARCSMIVSNLRLVVNIAKRYMNRGMQLQDLIEEGNIGLIRAVERFSASKGCRFSTYATYWIRQSVERSIINHAPVVRLPIHLTNDIARLHKIRAEFVRDKDREPSLVELSKRMGTSEKYVDKISKVNKRESSMDAVLGTETDETLFDRIEDTTFAHPLDMLSDIARAAHIKEYIRRLEKNEQDIIKLRFGLGKAAETLDTIGKKYGVTRERIRQIEARALKKLRGFFEEQKIHSMEHI